MSFRSAVVTFSSDYSSWESFRRSPCEFESAGGIEVHRVSWRRRRRLLCVDMEARFWVGGRSVINDSEVA